MSISDAQVIALHARETSSPSEIGEISLKDFPRLAKLRSELLQAKKAICVERARLLTRYFRRNGFDEKRPLLRQAKALRYMLQRMPTPVRDDELIMGSTTGKPLGVPIYPEFMSQGILPELTTLSKREFDPTAIRRSEADLLAHDVFDYWSDKTVHEWARRNGNCRQGLRLGDRMAFYLLTQSEVVTHIIPDYPSALQRGLGGLIKQAAQKEKEAKDAEAREFHRAVQIVLKGTLEYAERCSEACLRKARASKPARAKELREIAAMLKRVPEQPARTLHEALQVLWLLQVALHLENKDMALSFGRIDQYLHPYYKKDIEEGRLDRRSAAELIGSFFLKFGDHAPLIPQAMQSMFGGTSTNQAATVGGLRPDGSCGVNELTFLILKVAGMLALREPNLTARVTDDDPPEYVGELIRTIRATGASPALYGDKAVVGALKGIGVSEEDARDYGLVGCVEPTSCGRTFGVTASILMNLASVMELTLYDGVQQLSKMQIGPRTGRLGQFKNFEDFFAAFAKQLEFIAGVAVEGNEGLEKGQRAMHPTPLLSSLIEGTAESGRDVTAGGARYNGSGVAVIGFADVADSLAAVKSLVFDRKLIEPSELEVALRANFDDYEKIHAMLARKAPKHGNDDPEADEMAARLADLIAGVFEKHENSRGGRYHVGYWSMSTHVGFGKLTGALPNGRRKGAAFASGGTPVSGASRKGPTAALLSSAKLPSARIANCLAVNHKLSKALMDEPGKAELIGRLVEVYFRRGGMQVQFTVQDREDLLAAQKNPEEYRDLLVRVSGYTTYFCDLTRDLQNEIIARMEDAV